MGPERSKPGRPLAMLMPTAQEGPGARAGGSAGVTFIGHATLRIDLAGRRLLTDPIFGDRVGRWFTPRLTPLKLPAEEIAGIDGVLISHAHHDHLDFPSLRHVGRDVPVLVPWGVAPLLRARGHRRVTVARPWTPVRWGDVTITPVPARHFGGRLPLVYTAGVLGYVLEGERTIYFAGDTGFRAPLFRAIADRWAIDLAILPIAGYVFPEFRRNHMNASDALAAFRLVGARQMMAIHFEAFHASFEPSGHPRARLRAAVETAGGSDRVVIPYPGDRLALT
jgi:N-acyl-phosphatidylethanolamine-hydrolysing phospholipase D